MLSLILAFGFAAGSYIGWVSGRRYTQLQSEIVPLLPVYPQSQSYALQPAQRLVKVKAGSLTQEQLGERLNHLFKEKKA